MILPNLISIAIIKELPFAQKSKQLSEMNKSVLVVLNVMQARKTIWFLEKKRNDASVFFGQMKIIELIFFGRKIEPLWQKAALMSFLFLPQQRRNVLFEEFFFQLGSAQL